MLPGKPCRIAPPKGETLQNGAARELRQETGLMVNPDELTLMHINQNSSDPEKTMFKLYVFD